MATIKRFEDIESWKEARKLSAKIYNLCRNKPLALDYGLSDQIRRSAVSVMANIAEGFGRAGTKEFVQFLSQARGSISELKSHFYVLLDAGYVKENEFEDLYKRAAYIEILIQRLMDYLTKSGIKGRKYRGEG